MKKKWIIISVIVLVVGLIGFNIWKNTQTTTVTVETAALQKEQMQESVMTPGTLKLEEEQYVYVQADKGEVAEIFVEAGDQVKKGDQLLRYDNKQLELEQKQNQLQINSVYLELDTIKKQHREIDKEVEKDPDNEMIQEEHDQISMQEKQTNIELERALLEKEAIMNRMDGATVTANVTGTVLAVNENAVNEAQMAEQQPLIQIGSLDQVVVEGTISEYDTLHIEVGQHVLLTSDAVQDEEWQGKIESISDLPEEAGMDMGGSQESSVLYPIKVKVTENIPLKPGFNMLIEIITSDDEGETLPISAVQQTDGENFVYIVEDGKAKRTAVEIGAVDTEKMEIKSGVTKKDQIIKDPSDDIKDGTEVTVK